MLKHLCGFAAAFALIATVPCAAQATPAAGDARLQSLYQEYWDWQVAESGSIETTDGELDPGPTIPSASPEAHRARAEKAADFRRRLDTIDPDFNSHRRRHGATAVCHAFIVKHAVTDKIIIIYSCFQISSTIGANASAITTFLNKPHKISFKPLTVWS